ncbi:MAG TPA: hypothetical protein VH062_11925 [Polyangiaceae bacterium]|jgi:hypothetical protein|nr:hypothetical protein [Polyangiaceae bacterium]
MAAHVNVLYSEPDRSRSFEATDTEEFDRLAFAIQVIRVLRPRKLSVAVYRRYAELRIECVRDLRGGDGARWAMVGIPSRASRAQIAHALADLAGVADIPYAIDVLVNRALAPA